MRKTYPVPDELPIGAISTMTVVFTATPDWSQCGALHCPIATKLKDINMLRIMATLLVAVTTVWFATGQSGAASPELAGYVIEDITSDSQCLLTYQELAGGPAGEVLATESVSCPAGSVTTSRFGTAKDAWRSDSLFVPATASVEVDQLAIRAAKDSLARQAAMTGTLQLPGNPLLKDVPAVPPREESCSARSFSAGFSYWASDPGATIWATVYYSQNDGCQLILGSSSTSTSGSGLYWVKSYYNSPGFIQSHGCANITYGGINSGYYGKYIYGGGTFKDDSWNRPGCAFGWGTSYTGSVYF